MHQQLECQREACCPPVPVDEPASMLLKARIRTAASAGMVTNKPVILSLSPGVSLPVYHADQEMGSSASVVLSSFSGITRPR